MQGQPPYSKPPPFYSKPPPFYSKPPPFKTYSFEGCDWRKAEWLVLSWLRNRYQTVIDLRGEDWAQKLDVDFQAVNAKGRFWFYDVKAEANTHRTGNIAFEIVSNFGTGTPGAHLMSQAHYIAHVATGPAATGDDWILRVIDLKSLREWINKNGLRRFHCVPCGTKMSNGTFAYTTLSLLLPLFEIEQFVKWSGPLTETEADE